MTACEAFLFSAAGIVTLGLVGVLIAEHRARRNAADAPLDRERRPR